MILQGCGAEPRRSRPRKAYPNCSHIDKMLRTTQLPPYLCTHSLVLRRLSDNLRRDNYREGHIIISGQGHCRGVVFGNRIRDRVEFGGICDPVRRSRKYARFPLCRTPQVPDSVLIAFCKSWATVIHLSHSDDGPGIKLRQLARNAHQPESAVSGVRLLWTRLSNRSTDRRARRAVEWVFPSLHPVTRFVC